MLTTTSSAYDDSTVAVRNGSPAETEAKALYGQLTETERLGLLDGDAPFWDGLNEMMAGYNTRPIVHGAVERLGIPGLRFSDGPRGVVMGHSTAFPVSMARGATWDVDLEERVGVAIGQEVRAQGGNFFAGVCINLPRHPAWGRAQETYGEDPIQLGEFGAALTRGVRHQVMACVKHYALNSMENARFQVDVTADDQVLHEVYLPHFRRVVEEGVDAVMTAYNSVNGQWCGQNRTLITDILRGDWDFQGIAVSDFINGLRDATESLAAGLDVEEPFRQQRAEHLPADLASGRAQWADVDSAGLRILVTQLRFDAGRTAPEPATDVVASADHRALAREVAARSMVLLRNESVQGTPVLPIDPAALRTLAVIGRLADLPNTGDHGSSDVRAPEVITALAGLRAALPGVSIEHVPDDDPALAAAAAARCDYAIVVVGYTAQDEGEYADPSAFAKPDLVALFPPNPDAAPDSNVPEILVAGMGAVGAGGDRESLRLRPIDEELIRAVAAANPRTVVAVVTAGAVLMETWRTHVPGLVVMWYAGMEGGLALADVLLGKANPSGHLPFSIPTSEDHLPSFDRDAMAITYDRWHGQRLLDHLGVDAAYPLGFGLSYTQFTIDDVTVQRTGEDTFTAQVKVTNTGERPGHDVVQLYGTRAHPDATPERALLGFATAQIAAGATTTITVSGSLRPISSWSPQLRQLVPPTGPVLIEAAADAGTQERRTAELQLR